MYTRSGTGLTQYPIKVNPDDYLPSVMTCANYLKLPDYSSRYLVPLHFHIPYFLSTYFLLLNSLLLIPYFLPLHFLIPFFLSHYFLTPLLLNSILLTSCLPLAPLLLNSILLTSYPSRLY